jgi:hypothetical protein
VARPGAHGPPQQRKPRDGGRDDSRGDRPERSEKRADRPDGPERSDSKPARTRKPRKSADGGDQRGIDSSILPPSIRGDDSGPNNGGDSGALETVD